MQKFEKSKLVTPSQDTILIRSLAVPALIGVYPEERTLRQTLVFDVDLSVCIRAAAKTDDVNQAVDYAGVCGAIRAWVEQTDFQLIETLAEEIAARLLRRYPIRGVKLTLYKRPADLTDVDCVGVSIHRVAAE